MAAPDVVKADTYRAVFLYCPNDNCLLTPTEDKENKMLVYRCRICSYSRPRFRSRSAGA